MRSPAHPILAGAVLILSATLSHAQFVKGNEAVEPLPDGGHKVQLAPMPASVRKSQPCPADRACHAGSWLMVETETGLMECTDAYARPGTCRASSYGTTRRPRLWVVKSKGVWLQCQCPDLASKCAPMFARPPANLPYDALQ